MSPGQPSDPACPCGSGKAYATCCGAAPEPPGDVLTRVLALTETPPWDGAAERAMETYLAPLIADAGHGLPELMAQHPEIDELIQLHFREWLVGDYFDRDLRANLAEAYLAEHAGDETEDAREWLRGLRANRLSLYRVRWLEPGAMMTLDDLLRGDEALVVERVASRELQAGACAVTRVVPFAGRQYLSGAFLQLDPATADAARRDLERQIAEAFPEPAERDWETYLYACGPFFMNVYLGPLLDGPDESGPQRGA